MTAEVAADTGLWACDLPPFNSTTFRERIWGVVQTTAFFVAQTSGERSPLVLVKWCWVVSWLLADLQRVLRPGASFIFSVCVLHANWWIIADSSILGVFASAHPLDYLTRACRMVRSGGWLQSQVKIGRFHYLPIEVVREKLTEADAAWAASERATAPAFSGGLAVCGKCLP